MRHLVEAQQLLPCRWGSFKNHLALDQIYRDIRRLALACEHVQRNATQRGRSGMAQDEAAVAQPARPGRPLDTA